MMSNRKLIFMLLAAVLCAIARAGETPAGDADFFEKKIRPVLAEHCYKCHSAQATKLKGKLRLDSRAALLKGGDSGPAVVPGNLEKSLLIEAVLYGNQDLQMPPEYKLPDAAMSDLKAWVKAGASWPEDKNAPGDATAAAPDNKLAYEKLRKEHWAYQPIARVEPPTVKNETWPGGPIDRFILAKLEQKNLAPAPEADKRTLLRRVTFDVIGLPPTPEEIDAFLRDTSADAFAKVVDRLLASPHYGERWGRHWLDIARYAETAGGGRIVPLANAWRYRDYVIDAFNKDKPYSEFLSEQLAGDLLPIKESESPSSTDTALDTSHPFEVFAKRREAIIATGFLAIGPKNLDTQDKELLRMDVVDEQIDTVGKALLGMTTGCARCHDHKFDPIPTRDYYALAGIFRATKTLTAGNVSGVVQTVLPDPELREKVEAYEKQLAALDEQYTRIRTSSAPVKKATAQAGSLHHNGNVDPATLPGIVIDDAQANIVGTWVKSTSVQPYIGAGYLHDNNRPKGELSVVFSPAFPKTGVYEVRFAYSAHSGRSNSVPVLVQYADGETTIKVDEEKTPPIDGHFISLGRFKFNQGNDGSVTVANAGTKGVVTVDAVQFLAVEESGVRSQASGVKEQTPPPIAAVAANDEVETLKRIEKEIEELKKHAPAGPAALAVKDEEQVGDHNICLHGDAHRLGEQVPRGFLSAVSFEAPAVNPKQSGRVELARWMVDPRNPLTSRVMANRVWHHLFGAGLVRTTDNFGITGEAPSHPQLLDWLAGSFMDNGWSVKRLVREIVLSKTYRQSAAMNAAAAKVDPENRWIWRANRRRLEAEAIRDAMLMISGQLDLGGSPGAPLAKADAKAEIKKNTRQSRTVYMPLTREDLNDMLEVFDFADANLVVGNRNSSNLPTQALFMMNSPFVMEQARLAAQNINVRVSDRDENVDGRIELAYITVLGRPPTEAERKLSWAFVGDATKERWAQFYQALFACVDFRFVD